MNKKTVAVIFGGYSSEHEVSRVSASTIISNIDTEKYYVLPIGITKEGKWLLYNGSVDKIRNGEWERYGVPAIISPDKTSKSILKIVNEKVKNISVDVIFPVLHGLNGEDGTIQGLFELSGIPYVGCGVLSSSVSMDKAFTKIIAKNAKVKQAKYLVLYKDEADKQSVLKKIETSLGFPCFVKPANAGSSVGISKAHNKEELKEALLLASMHDRKIIIEEAVVGREVECAVLGLGKKAVASSVGEVLAAAEFYDYDAKYNNSASKTVIPADLPEKITKEIQKTAVKIFAAVDGTGLSRVDFFVEKDTNNVVFNEINTLPGFTPISMYPMLFADSGIKINELIDRLIDLAFEAKNI